MIAAMKGHKDTILMLIQKGANLNLINKVSMYYSINITRHSIVMKAEVILRK